jgi:hypothetical protein
MENEYLNKKLQGINQKLDTYHYIKNRAKEHLELENHITPENIMLYNLLKSEIEHEKKFEEIVTKIKPFISNHLYLISLMNNIINPICPEEKIDRSLLSLPTNNIELGEIEEKLSLFDNIETSKIEEERKCLIKNKYLITRIKNKNEKISNIRFEDWLELHILRKTIEKDKIKIDTFLKLTKHPFTYEEFEYREPEKNAKQSIEDYKSSQEEHPDFDMPDFFSGGKLVKKIKKNQRKSKKSKKSKKFKKSRKLIKRKYSPNL